MIPVGAILVGMVSNSGYYFSASITHRILDKYDFLAMACLAGAGMFLIYGLEYYYYVEKEDMGNIISFFQYLAYVTENSSYSVKFSKISLFTDIGSLGILGYCFLFIHFVGFIIGGAITFLLLFGADTCSKCSKYFRNKKKKTLFFSCVQDFNAYFAKVSEVDPDSNALQSTLFEDVTSLNQKNEGSIKYTWQLKKCGTCKTELLSGNGDIFQGKEWSSLKDSGTKIVMPNHFNLERDWPL